MHAPPNRSRLATETCQLEWVGPEAALLGSPDSQHLARPPGAQKLLAAPRLSLPSLRASARHAATSPHQRSFPQCCDGAARRSGASPPVG